MKLVLGNNFPTEPPKAFFLTKIFHPNVSSNGEICVNTLKKDWKPELGIKHILLVCTTTWKHCSVIVLISCKYCLQLNKHHKTLVLKVLPKFFKLVTTSS